MGTHKHTAREVERIEFKTFRASELASGLAAGPPVDWLWPGCVAAGHLTVLRGQAKSGKTTFISELASRVSKDPKALVIIITEESLSNWSRRVGQFELGENVVLVSRPLMNQPSSEAWPLLIAQIEKMIEEDRRCLVIFDTLAGIQSMQPARKPGCNLAQAYVALHALTERGAAVVVVDGSKADSRRAAPANVDVMLEFARFDPLRNADGRRVLRVSSRLEQPPGESIYVLQDGRYREAGECEHALKNDRQAIVTALLKDHPKGLALEQLLKLWPDTGGPRPSRGTLHATLTEMKASGVCERSGTGTRGSPHLYSVPDPSEQRKDKVMKDPLASLPPLPDFTDAEAVERYCATMERLMKQDDDQAERMLNVLERIEKMKRKVA